MIWKSTFREMKQSLGRFLAIMAIVALGVGFFAGLKVTRSAMVKTTGEYLQDYEFYDYRLLSTMGFAQEEVEYLREKEDVENAEGAVSFDIIYEDESGSEGVVKAHSIMDSINCLKVVSGRMPEKADECVVDSNLFSDAILGKTFTLSENNAEEDLEHFAYREYTVVGTVQSPYYIQYERGNTSLGTGKINGFIYLSYEGFDVDYYTEIFVNFTENFPLYSDEYDDFIAEKELLWEDYAKEAGDMRYREILDEAEEELADAREEFETEKADAETDLEEAEKKLADAEEQLADGERKLADAKKELEDAKRTVAEKERELADAELELAKKEQEIADAEQTLAEGISSWNDNSYRLNQSKSELDSGRKQLEEQKKTLEAKEAELIAGEAALEEAEGSLKLQRQQLEGQAQELAVGRKELLALYGEGNIPKEMMAQLQAAEEQIAAGMTMVDAGLAGIAEKRQEIEAGRMALTEGSSTIASYEQELNAGEAQIKAGNQALADAWKEIEQGRQELADGRIALEDAKVQLEDGRVKLEDAKRDIKEGERTLWEKEQELADAKVEYEDGLKEYENGVEEFNQKIADAEQKLADAEQEIEDIQEPDSYLLGRDTNVGYVCFENDSAIVEGIANIFPVFFFLVAALVCITTMNRMVEEQRTQIGVLKALGYGEGVIMSKYMFYSGTAAVIGAIIGFAGGTYLFPKVIWTAYGIMYRLDRLLYVFNGKLALISLVVAILCSVGTTWMSCRMELKQVAAQLMRPKSPKAGKRVFLEYLPFIWKRLGFLRKVSARNIFRYKKRLIMMVMGIGGCTALLVTGFGIKDSIADVAVQQFEEIQIYDLNILYTEEITEREREEIERIVGVDEEQYTLTHESAIDLVTEGGRKSVNLLVFDSLADMSPFLNLHTKEDEQIAFPGRGEAVITDKIAETYGIDVGDVITLQNEDMQTVSATITGINQNFIYNYVYINNETYREQIGRDAEYKNAYINAPEDADPHLISAALMKCDNVASVTVNEDTMERFAGMMESLNLVVLFVIACAAGLAFIVLYNLTNINITERIREIATIKVLGFHKKETASYVFRENVVLAAMGIVVGLLLGHYLHLFVMNEINIDMIAFDIRVRPISYLYSVLLTFVFAWGVNMIMGGKLERISMTESLKSVD